ncbi:hypothetical protein GALMADRAFT_150582 [Galerina marginata CBS 339.88]|uniref:Ribosomal protein L7/L12 C-terminal domain-containing protein n=1 Tax=Galerina marginata (strain CBS 339.88) TaxID=685588 RepID=A0A067TJV5_GALM3|nr:hypothetical protein GALMADRAFT_150582 [Galerina marginata CBS 339.88]
MTFLHMASRCTGVLRVIPRPTSSIRCSRIANSARWLATTTESKPSKPLPPPQTQTSSNPTITRIVDDISGLTLLQASDLVTQLKARLNIQEVAMPSVSAAAAPAAAAPAADEPAAEKPKEKTVFNVKLESFDAGSKPKVIREVKALVPNLTLMDAKKFVESLPKILKENISKEEAEKLQKAFESIGAVVKLD